MQYGASNNLAYNSSDVIIIIVHSAQTKLTI